MSFNFFQALSYHPDVAPQIFSWLNLHGPTIVLIDDKPTDEQKQVVTAVALDKNGKPDVNRSDLSTYHLIAGFADASKTKAFSIGFCQRTADNTLTYATKPLDIHSQLLRYITEHPHILLKSATARSQDSLLIKYITLEIKSAGGLTYSPLRNRTRLAGVNQRMNAWMNSRVADENHQLSTKQVFKQNITQTLLEKLLHHIAYHELPEAKAIVEIYPQLLLSHHKGEVEDASLAYTFPSIGAVPLAYLNGWHFPEMFLEVTEHSKLLSTEDRNMYRQDIGKQIEELKEQGVNYILNNLVYRGVRIIDEDTFIHNKSEQERFIAEVVGKNCYHLIIDAQQQDGTTVVLSCTLGYQNPQSKNKNYCQYNIPKEHALFAEAGELYDNLLSVKNAYYSRHDHKFTREYRHLNLVKSILTTLGVETQWKETTTHMNVDKILDALNDYLEKMRWGTGSLPQLADYLHCTILAETRLFPNSVRQFWNDKNFPWGSSEEEMENYIRNSTWQPIDNNHYGEPIFPSSISLGGDDPRGVLWPGRLKENAALPEGFRRARRALKSILEVATTKHASLNSTLKMAAFKGENGNPENSAKFSGFPLSRGK